MGISMRDNQELVSAVLQSFSSGSLTNDDADVNENSKKAIVYFGKKNNSARASRFFVHFFVVIARLRRENA